LNALDARDRQETKVETNHLLMQALGRVEAEIASGRYAGGDDFGERWEGYAYEFDAQAFGESWPNLYEVTVRISTPNDSAEPFETTQLVYSGTQF
jgi:hypothetical protein